MVPRTEFNPCRRLDETQASDEMFQPWSIHVGHEERYVLSQCSSAKRVGNVLSRVDDLVRQFTEN